LVLYQIGITILNFFCMMLITRILGVEARGQIVIYNNALAIFSTFFSFSLGSGIVYFVANQQWAVGKMVQQLWYAFIVIVILLFISIGMVIFTGQQYRIIAYPTSTIMFWVFGVQVIINIIFSWITALLNAKNSFVLPLAIQFIALLMQTIIVIGIYNHWWLGSSNSSITQIIMIVLLIAFVQLLFLIIYFIQAEKIIFSASSTFFQKPFFTYSAMAFACNIVQLLCYRIDIWFLQSYHNYTIVGIYSIAVLCLQMLWILPNQFSTILFTRFSKARHSHHYITPITVLHSIVFWASFFVFGLAWLCSYIFVPLLFGTAYQSSFPLLGILLLGGIPISSALVISTYFASINRLSINLKGSILGLIICIIFNFLWIPKYSYYGAAAASAIAYIGNCTYLWIQFIRIEKISFFALFSWQNLTLKNIKTTWHELQQS
jgi:O-antigen/teichoic acid export membrane protein